MSNLTGNPAVDLATGVMGAQIAILAGLINQKIVDPLQLRNWLKELIDDLKPEERTQPYGICLQQVVNGLEKNALRQTSPPKLH